MYCVECYNPPHREEVILVDELTIRQAIAEAESERVKTQDPEYYKKFLREMFDDSKPLSPEDAAIAAVCLSREITTELLVLTLTRLL